MKSFVLSADLLGFKKMVKNLNEEELDQRLNVWIKLVEELIREFKITRFKMFSDTLVVSTDPTKEGFGSLIKFSKAALERGIIKSFPIRGGIAYGDISWGKEIISGKALIKAYEIEKSQEWIGITCENGIPHLEDYWSIENLITYPTPKKQNDVIELHPIISWEIPKLNDLTKILTKGGLAKKGESLYWDFGHKTSNTIQLKFYKEILEKNKKDPSKFLGILPAELIEIELEKHPN
ncbi:hypothetical protein K9N08_01160 [Candidatus Gracilibacteria bacterium]|nr:hypothetical protein [Candidatus Gracilibacteria bacterium]MCF7856151.1 hypothetical protein [Candidatus Gracilibacteria bacterium]MCF7896617.1 hypothetical protein [Candidatus Gracilibacteria bacterium]